MAKQYTQNFKEMMVELHNTGKRPSELSQEYDVPIQTLGKWFTKVNKEATADTTADDIATMRAELLKAK
jgi:transposase